MTIVTLLASSALASSLGLALHEPSGRPGPLDTCDISLCKTLLERIEGAERTVDIAIYGMRGQTAVLDAIKKARARGVRVRAVVDMDLAGKNYYADTDAFMTHVDKVTTDHAADQLKASGMREFMGNERCERPVGFEGPLQCAVFDLGDRCLYSGQASREPIAFQGDIMHHKFAVIDGRHVWTGSTNVSDSCAGGYNANLVVTVDSPTVAGWYLAEFEQMLGGRFHGEKASQGTLKTELDDGSEVQVLFSPQDKPITKGVRPALKNAKRRIDVAIFFLTHKGIAQDLIDAHRRGVKVRVIMDATAGKNEYTKHEILREAGIPVKVEHWGGKMHAKSAVIDGEVVIAGSMNWTSAGEGGNDENTLIIRSMKHGATFEAWFDRMWAAIPDTWLVGRPDPESRDSGAACTDGVDNDYDHLADDADPGCSDEPPPLPALPPYVILPKTTETCSPDFRYIHW